MCGRSNSVSPVPMPGQSPTRWNVIFQPAGSNTLAALSCALKSPKPSKLSFAG